MKELITRNILDKILKHCAENNGKQIFPSNIKKNIFPELNDDEITMLLKRISNTIDPVVNIGILICNCSKLNNHRIICDLEI